MFLRPLVPGRLALSLVAVLLASISGQAQTQMPRIPVAHGTSLTGQPIVLPDALKAKLGILILGFSHGSQEQVLNWGRLINSNYADDKNLDYFEIPMLGGAPKMLRGMIIKSMGKSVPAAQKPHFVPLTDDDKPWKTAAHYDKPDDAYLLIVDEHGEVRWQTQGDATDTAWSSFKSEINQLLNSVSR